MSDKPCRHYAKYKAVHQPKCNCAPCWDKYFYTHPYRAASVDIAVERHGFAAIEAVMGTKYLKQLEKFKERDDARRQLRQNGN